MGKKAKKAKKELKPMVLVENEEISLSDGSSAREYHWKRGKKVLARVVLYSTGQIDFTGNTQMMLEGIDNDDERITLFDHRQFTVVADGCDITIRPK